MKGHPMWNRSRRVTLATSITVDHVCASAAIPLVFQPVRLKTARGTAFFSDGCVRLQQPLSPVIRLGAEKIFAIHGLFLFLRFSSLNCPSWLCDDEGDPPAVISQKETRYERTTGECCPANV
jgi:predicted acylesterase/phospholipase RssA